MRCLGKIDLGIIQIIPVIKRGYVSSTLIAFPASLARFCKYSQNFYFFRYVNCRLVYLVAENMYSYKK